MAYTSDSSSESSSEELQLMRKSVRSKPKRYIDHDHYSFDDESASDPFGGNSSEEIYAPPPKKRKEKKIENAHTLPKLVQKGKTHQQQMATSSHSADFNKQFFDLSAKNTKGSVKELAPIISIMRTGSSQKPSATVADATETSHHLNALSHSCCKHSLNNIEKKMDEVLARFAVFERKLLYGQMTNMKKEANLPDPKEFEQHEAFMRSNRMPIEIINELNRFEENLKSSEFSNAAVSCQHI